MRLVSLYVVKVVTRKGDNTATWRWENMDIARVQGAEHTGAA